jgi:hypothetical protein
MTLILADEIDWAVFGRFLDKFKGHFVLFYWVFSLFSGGVIKSCQKQLHGFFIRVL